MDLREEILAKCSPELLASRDVRAIAEKVSEGRVQLVETLIGERSVFRALGMPEGTAFLNTLKAIARREVPGTEQLADSIAYVVGWLKDDKLDVADETTRAQIDGMVQMGLLTAEQGAALKSRGERPAPVSEVDIIKTLWNDNGDWTL